MMSMAYYGHEPELVVRHGIEGDEMRHWKRERGVG
jgi:hypothetical protein